MLADRLNTVVNLFRTSDRRFITGTGLGDTGGGGAGHPAPFSEATAVGTPTQWSDRLELTLVTCCVFFFSFLAKRNLALKPVVVYPYHVP
jgi:hypothetical protein